MSRLRFKEHSHREFYYTTTEDENQQSTSGFLHSAVEHKIQPVSTSVSKIGEINDCKVEIYKPSNWLSQFLSKKRVDDLCLVPDMMPMQDDFIKEFHQRFSKASSSDYDNDFIDEQKSVGEVNDVKFVDTNTLLASITLFNLPYTASAEEVIIFGKKNGFTFSNVVLNTDKKTNLPSGSALCDISDIELLDDQVIDIPGSFNRLHGQSLGGRPIRVSYGGEKRRNSSGRDNSRYFGIDISKKCSLCGIVGHKQNDCSNDPIPFPCHLCAGKDHEAVGCPNITCYRCGRFGHHSKDCQGNSYSKASICVQCGSTSHDIRFCAERSTLDNSRVQGQGVRCMVCSSFGHCLCLKIMNVTSKNGAGDWRNYEDFDIYCPNCGKKGHHVDFSITVEEPQCQCPKYEAFVKYPNLLKDLEYCDSDSERQQMCMGALRGGVRDMQLFPFLLPPKRPLNRSSFPPSSSSLLPPSYSSRPSSVQRSSSALDTDEPHYSQRGRMVVLESEERYRSKDSYNNSSWRKSLPSLPYTPQQPHQESSRYDSRDDDGEYKSRDRERNRGRSLYEEKGRRVYCEEGSSSSSNYGNEQYVSSKSSSKSNNNSSRKRSREVEIDEAVSESRNHRKKH